MMGTVADHLAPVRAALTLLVVGIASLLAASVLAPQVSAESVLVIAALGTATAAALGVHRLVVLPRSRPLMLPARPGSSHRPMGPHPRDEGRRR